MKSRIYFFAILSITLALAYTAAAQAPVLFDGTNPVPLNFQSAEGQGALPSDDAIPRSQLITPE
ncbi:MAG TPA: hypothetical protein VF772_19235 [Terriglobales bacterium]